MIFTLYSKYRMSFNVGMLWGAYIIVMVITFILFGLLFEAVRSSYNYDDSGASYSGVLFLASVAGALTVFIGTAYLNPTDLTNSDKTLLSVLFIVAFLFPLFIIFYIVWI